MMERDEYDDVYTVDEALCAMEFGKYQTLVLGYAGLGWLADAMEMMLLSFVGPSVKTQWGLSSTQEGLLTTVVFGGMLLGAFLWGLISDAYGRRISFLGISILTSLSAFLSSFSPNYIVLLTLRSVVGFGLGGGSVFLSWFLEFVPASNRGMWMVVFSAFWSLGSVFEASLAWIVMPTLNWRWLLALSSLPSFGLLLFYNLVPESPRFLCATGSLPDANQILHKIALLNGTQLPSGILVSDDDPRITTNQAIQQQQQQNDDDDEFDPLLPPSPPTTHKHKAMALDFKRAFSSFLRLFSPKYVQTTLLLWILFFGNAFSYYGVVLLTSQLSLDQTQCLSTTFNSNNVQDASLYADVFIANLAEVPGLLLSAIFVDRIGRKLSMVVMFILACIVLLPLVHHQSATLTTVSLFGARMCTMGTFTVACIYAPELYPTSMRATAAGAASAMGRIGGMVCPMVAVGLASGCNQTAAILLFEAVMVLSMVSVLFFQFETLGQKLSNT